MKEAKARKRLSNFKRFLITVSLLIALILAFWLFVPRPVVSPAAQIFRGPVLTVIRDGEYEKSREVDEATGEALLECLRRYTWVPRLRYYNPRFLSEIPFEIDLFVYDEGPKQIVLGNDFYWYRSAAQHLAIYYDILDGEALLKEVMEITGIER